MQQWTQKTTSGIGRRRREVVVGYPQELGGDRRGGLEQRLRVVAAEQLDLPIPAAGVAERVRNSGERLG